MSAESRQQGVHQDEQRWLVRSVRNRISGPFTLRQVRDLIERGELELGDEVCNANAYWFYLREADEVRAQLGIEIPKQLYSRKAEEATETQTDATNLDRTDPELGSTRRATVIRSSTRAESAALPEPPELESSFEELGENTAVMSNRAFRDYRHKKPAPLRPAQAPIPAVRSPKGISMERSKLLQILAYVMMVGAVVLVIAVIKLLQQQPG